MKTTVVLNLGGTNDVQVCVDADAYCNSITAASNPNFIAPAVSAPVAASIAAQVTLTRTAVTALRTAIAAPVSATRSDTITANRSVVDSNLNILGNMVENVANAPAVLDVNREGIVHSAGMRTKSPGGRKITEFSVKNLNIHGSVQLDAPGGVAAHMWEYTSDAVNFTNRQLAETTTVASTVISGLTSGVNYAFFHKPVSNKGVQPWDGPVFLIVT